MKLFKNISLICILIAGLRNNIEKTPKYKILFNFQVNLILRSPIIPNSSRLQFVTHEKDQSGSLLLNYFLIGTNYVTV